MDYAGLTFVVDFDGTIAPTDTIDTLLDRFADPAWTAIEEEWIAGHIDSRACMSRQLALVDADSAHLDDFFRSVRIDPGFAAFARYVQGFARLAVVSDGLDLPIRLALARAGLASIPVYANAAQLQPRGIGIGFPYYHSACRVQSGVCKCNVARTLGGRTILVGDGRSDRCLARSAEHVFAKNSLRDFCAQERIAHTPFDDFQGLLAIVRRWQHAHATDDTHDRKFHAF